MLIINLVGIALIVLIIWWFWLYTPSKLQKTLANSSDSEINIVVQDGVYQPSTIMVTAGTSPVIKFIRKDATPCAATLLIPDFEITEELPLNKTIEIALPIMKKGEYAFHCQMQMYKGSLVVE